MKNVSPQQFKLANSHGIQIQLMEYGATLTSLKIPDPKQGLVEVTLGFDHLDEYLRHQFYFGCTVGRVANRIANGQFTLQDQTIQLYCNENAYSHLHGGSQGFDKVFWQGQQQDNTVTFTHSSTANAEGYPGNLATTVIYQLTKDNELKIHYRATTDAPTPVNLTNHTYWNLRGAGSGDILAHELEIFASQYLETDHRHLPTGQVLAVGNSALDFQSRKTIGKHLAQIRGYDHCYLLQGELAARVRDPDSGRVMEVRTTKPGMQFYSGNYLADTQIAQHRRTQQWGGFCLETQSFPDAVNQPHFPSIILLPEEVYEHTTTYQFYFSAKG